MVINQIPTITPAGGAVDKNMDASVSVFKYEVSTQIIQRFRPPIYAPFLTEHIYRCQNGVQNIVKKDSGRARQSR